MGATHATKPRASLDANRSNVERKEDGEVKEKGISVRLRIAGWRQVLGKVEIFAAATSTGKRRAPGKIDGGGEVRNWGKLKKPADVTSQPAE